jgi:hypothetical protein
MDPIWQDLPLDIVLQHILPKCDIEFKIKPQKIDLDPFRTGDFDASMKLRYAPNPFKCKSKMQYVYIPLHTAAGWSKNYDDYRVKCAIVNLGVWYN